MEVLSVLTMMVMQEQYLEWYIEQDAIRAEQESEEGGQQEGVGYENYKPLYEGEIVNENTIGLAR